MTSAVQEKTALPRSLDKRVLARISEEGYGPGAWHGNDLRAALSDVPATLAFKRPAKGRHNIAEIALHHAYVIRNVRAQLLGTPPEAFVLEGDDWFPVDDESKLTWKEIRDVVEKEQKKLTSALDAARTEHFDIVLGLTCHAIYHAGQVQLIKALLAK
jgi:hypothetical protein